MKKVCVWFVLVGVVCPNCHYNEELEFSRISNVFPLQHRCDYCEHRFVVTLEEDDE